MEDYKEKYEQALEKAKIYYDVDTDNTMTIYAKGTMEYLFPELAESEDEKILEIIKHCIESRYLHTSTIKGISQKQCLAWLEKQGEQKHSIDINKMVDDYANNKEPGNEIFGKPVPCMVRAYRQGLNDAIGKVVLKPAWSEEDEEMLKSIMATCELAEQERDSSPARHLLEMQLDWLKSLKDRIQLKQEWNEEDESLRLRTIGALETCKIGSPTKCVDEQINWLKSLKERYTWKPTDEQMKVLDEVLNFAANHESPYWNDYIFGTLNNLIRQLKN